MSETAPAQKRKLLVVVGAGASIEFGMPSVDRVAGILSTAAQEYYPLHADGSTNLYKYLENAVTPIGEPNRLSRIPNFEEILYSVFALAAAFQAGRFTSPLGAFVTAKPLPDVNWMEFQRKTVGPELLRQFGHFLVDALLDSFRGSCRTVYTDKKAELAKLQAFFRALAKEFQISVVTLNYDDIIYRSAPGLETGFDESGRFVDERILLRKTWPCILHLHGSVHFNMRDDYSDFLGFGGLHDIHWQDNLDEQFNQNAAGRSSFSTIEGLDFPTSSIIAGYGKTTQILRRPFRTYYAEIDRLAATCDAVLFLGYGFSDIHLDLAFEKFRDHRHRPAVVIDFAQDNAMTANGAEMSAEYQTVPRVLDLLRTLKHTMTWLGHTFPNRVARLKAAKEFEISNNPDTPLAIWYNGMLAACDNIEKVMVCLGHKG
jgi:hypothetical protein